MNADEPGQERPQVLLASKDIHDRKVTNQGQGKGIRELVGVKPVCRQREGDERQAEAIEALERSGQPVVRISLSDVYDLGQEFFRWEIATAVAGAVIGINPFNQPDVEASKVATRKLTEEYEQKGSLPSESPFFEEGGIKLFADERNSAALREIVRDQSLAGYLQAHLSRLQAGDYFAMLAYVQMNDEHES